MYKSPTEVLLSKKEFGKITKTFTFLVLALAISITANVYFALSLSFVERQQLHGVQR